MDRDCTVPVVRVWFGSWASTFCNCAVGLGLIASNLEWCLFAPQNFLHTLLLCRLTCCLVINKQLPGLRCNTVQLSDATCQNFRMNLHPLSNKTRGITTRLHNKQAIPQECNYTVCVIQLLSKETTCPSSNRLRILRICDLEALLDDLLWAGRFCALNARQ